jgi:hypothetical protein
MPLLVQGGSVSFEELAGSPKIDASIEIVANQASRGHRGATRRGRVAWANIDAAIAECFPAAPALPGAYPGVAYLYAKGMKIEPWSGDGGGDPVVVSCASTNVYSYADITVSYETLPYDTSTLISRRYSFSHEFISLPGTTLFWFGTDPIETVQHEDVRQTKSVSIIEHSITWHRVDTIPWTTIRANVGKVNDGGTALNANYFPAGIATESLLFLGAEISETYDSAGNVVRTLEYRFQERSIKVDGDVYGWNHLYNPAKGIWGIPLSPTGARLYKTSTTFNDLFA